MAGFTATIQKVRGKIAASWIAARPSIFATKSLSYQLLGETVVSIELGGVIVGAPGAPIVLSRDKMIFGCLGRICKSSDDFKKVSLVNGSTEFSGAGAVIQTNKFDYFIAIRDRRLVVIRLNE